MTEDNEVTAQTEDDRHNEITSADIALHEPAQKKVLDPDMERMQPGVATGKYEVLVKEKKGFFASAIPTKLPCCVAVLLCFFNCIIPGLGTLISAPFSLCDKGKPQKQRTRNFLVNILAAILQLLTTVLLLIGYLWSIMWAIEFLKPLKGDEFEDS